MGFFNDSKKTITAQNCAIQLRIFGALFFFFFFLGGGGLIFIIEKKEDVYIICKSLLMRDCPWFLIVNVLGLSVEYQMEVLI